MVDSVVNQEPSDLQDILYSKSVPVLSRMLSPDMGEATVNNYEVVDVKRKGPYSEVTVKITKALTSIVDAKDDEVRTVVVDYEHHSLESILAHFLGKGEIAVSKIPTSLDDINEILMGVSDKIILEEDDITALFTDNKVVLYVTDPLDLRWWGNATLTFKLADNIAPPADEEEEGEGEEPEEQNPGGAGGEEPGKSDPEPEPTPVLTNLVHNTDTTVISVDVVNATTVFFKIGDGAEHEVAVVNGKATYTVGADVAGGAAIVARAGEVSIQITAVAVVRITNVGYDRTTKTLSADLANVTSVTVSYGGKDYPGKITGNRMTFVFSDVPFNQTITLTANDGTRATFAMPAALTTITEPSYNPYTNELTVKVSGTVGSTGVKYTTSNGVNGSLALSSGKYSAIITESIPAGTTITINTVDASAVIEVAPWLESITITNETEQRAEGNELNLVLTASGSPYNVTLPAITYTILDVSENVVAEITNGNVLSAVGIEDGSHITVRAIAVSSGTQIVDEKTFTMFVPVPLP